MTDAFIHIPKTAGTTLRKLLKARHPDLFACYRTPPFKPIDALDDRERKRLREAGVVFGHETLANYQAALPSNTRYSTVVRDPIDRVLSFYNHVVRNRREGAVRISLLKFLESMNHEVQNLQVQYLSGMETDWHVVKRAHLDAAKENIVSGKVQVALHEDLPGTLQHLGLFHSLSATDLDLRENESVDGLQRRGLSSLEISQIRYLNRFDVSLYGFVREHLKTS